MERPTYARIPGSDQSPPSDGHSNLAAWRHDIRNLLHIISGYASLLESDQLSATQKRALDEIQAAVHEIHRSLERLSAEDGESTIVVVPDGEGPLDGG